MHKGKLYLIPTTIDATTENDTILPAVKDQIKSLNYFLVENVRSARRFISGLKLGISIEALQFELLDKNTTDDVVEAYLQKVLNGENVGIMSEAGCPGVADPGASAVKIAHRLGIQVTPLVGPSSILLALMASGFNGQCFKFHGYLAIDKRDRVNQLKKLEKESQQLNQTQIFIETPYRNDKMVEDIISHCSANTKLCIAKAMTSINEYVKTRSLKQWKGHVPILHKTPCVFILYAGNA